MDRLNSWLKEDIEKVLKLNKDIYKQCISITIKMNEFKIKNTTLKTD